jgi:hypothetical protein
VKRLLSIVIILALLITAASAKDLTTAKGTAISVGVHNGEKSVVNISEDNTITYATSKVALAASPTVSGVKKGEIGKAQKDIKGKTIPAPAIFSYTYDGNLVKETIVLNEYRDLSFDLALSEGSRIIPYDGGYRIFKTDADNLRKLNDPIHGGIPEGIQILAPTAVDANGRTMDIRYAYDGKAISLVFNHTYIQVLNQAKTGMTGPAVFD